MEEIKRVAKKEFENEVEDKVATGFKVVSKTDEVAVLEKRNFGKAVWHILILILTFWTWGLGNIVYLLFSYFARVDRVTIKIKK